MKQSPQLNLVQQRMQPGVIARDGFLGSDRRSLVEMLEEDDNSVRSLGLTHAQIAERMDYFMRIGRRGLGTSVVVDDGFEVRVEDVRGVLPCPWAHSGTYGKTNVSLKNLKTGDELFWTALQVHMIGKHGFYEGRGSPFRIDPAEAKRALDL